MSAAGAAAGEGAWTPAYSVAGARNPWTIVGVISIATFMVVLDAAIANVALAHIAGGLSISYDESTWVITSFLIANAIIIPISGWLADVIGRKRYYMISVALFTLASVACGLSQSLTMLVIARVAQGIGGGGLAPVEQSMLVDTFPPKSRGAAFAAYGIVVVVGPILGPSLGGWITDHLSWHWIFLINAPFGCLSLVLVSLYVDEPPALLRRRERTLAGGLRVDFIGFLLVAILLGCLEVTLDRGQRDNWFSSPLIVGFALSSVMALLVFIPWELTRKDPIVRIGLFAKRNFGIANLLMLVVGMIIFGTTQFIPQLLQEVLGYTAEQAGVALTIGGLATFVMMPVSGFLTSRVDARYLVGFAMVVEGMALWHLSLLNTHITFMDAAIARMYQAVGLPLLFVPITNAAYVGLQPEDSNQASALLNVSRNLGGTFGISLVQTMLAQRKQFHQASFVARLNPLNPVYHHAMERLTHALTARGLSAVAAGRVATAMIYREVVREAAMFSYVEVFHVLMWVVFASVPLVLLMHSTKTSERSH